MQDIALGGYFGARFTTTDDTGANADADATPTYRVVVPGSDVNVATGNCRKPAGTTGAYEAYFQVAAGPFTAGIVYQVLVTATVDALENEDVEVGFFRAQAAGATVHPTLEQIELAAFAGTGAWPVTLYVKAGAVPIQGAKVRINATGGNVVLTTNSAGAVVLALDTGTYTAYVGTGASYTPAASYTVTVSAAGAVTAPAGGILTVTAVSLPTPSDPDCYLLYAQERQADASDAAFGAAGLSVKVLRIELPGRLDSDAAAIRTVVGTEYQTDASGMWSMELAKTAFEAKALLVLERGWDDAEGTAVSEIWQVTLDDASASAGDQICLADLSIRRGQ